MTYTIPQLFNMEMEQLAKERGKDPDPELWRWSPLDIYEFDRMLNVAYYIVLEHRTVIRADQFRTILYGEAGCGIGTKLYLAKIKYNFRELGYEINDEYLERCRLLGVHAEKWDLREETPPWEKFDIVYLSRPFKDDTEESEWERSVHEAMRPGTVLVSAFTALKPYNWKCYYRYPFHGVWQKPFSAPGNYTSAIRRSTTGSDPLVPEPHGTR